MTHRLALIDAAAGLCDAVAAAADLDAVLARASLARSWDASIPIVGEEGHVCVHAARHPLLLLKEPHEQVVAKGNTLILRAPAAEGAPTGGGAGADASDGGEDDLGTALINSASDFEMLDDGADDVLTPDEEAGASTAAGGSVDGRADGRVSIAQLMGGAGGIGRAGRGRTECRHWIGIEDRGFGARHLLLCC